MTTRDRLTRDAPGPFWQGAAIVWDSRHGYLQQLDEAQLARWAAAHGTALRLLVRPGDYLFPDAAIALALPAVDGVGQAVRDATVVNADRSRRRRVRAGRGAAGGTATARRPGQQLMARLGASSAEPVFDDTSDLPLIWEAKMISVDYIADRNRAEAIMLEAARPHTRTLADAPAG